MNHECVICFEKRKRGFTCPNTNCAIWTCLPCYKKSLDDYGIICMACTTPISDSLWYDLFPKSFVNTHIHEKSSVELFERYRAQLPTVQDAAEAVIENRDLFQQLEVKNEEVKKLKRMLAHKNNQREDLLTKINHREQIINGSLTKFEKTKRVIRCLTENCNAFLDEKMKCGVCVKQYCGQCQSLKHEGDCDPIKVADIQYIKRNTRACPRCSTNIQKIEGCDQMFCVVPECNTFFSYQSGKEIRSGPLHNPHYIERLRAGGVVQFRQAIDGIEGIEGGNCENLPSILTLQRAFLVTPRVKDPIYNSILNFHRSITHITDSLTQHTDDEEPRDIRAAMIKFLLGKDNLNGNVKEEFEKPYTKEMFISAIKTHYKIDQFQKNIRTILSTCRDVSRDILRNFVQTPYDISVLYQELQNIADITNKELFGIAKIYNWKPRDVFIINPLNEYHLDFRANRRVNFLFSPWTDTDNPRLIII